MKRISRHLSLYVAYTEGGKDPIGTPLRNNATPSRKSRMPARLPCRKNPSRSNTGKVTVFGIFFLPSDLSRIRIRPIKVGHLIQKQCRRRTRHRMRQHSTAFCLFPYTFIVQLRDGDIFRLHGTADCTVFHKRRQAKATVRVSQAR